jgi:cell division protease FtsH
MDNKPFRPGQGSNPPSNRKSYKNAGFIALVVLLALIIFAAYSQPSSLKNIPLTQAISSENGGQYKEIEIHGNELDITVKGQNQASLKTYTDPNTSLKSIGFNFSKTTIEYTSTSTGSAWLTLGLEYVLPIILIGLLFFWMIRSAQGQGNQALSFGKSRARLYGNEKDKVSF